MTLVGQMLMEEGYQRGMEKGMEKGIQVFIQDNVSENIPKQRIIQKLQANFSLMEEEAINYYTIFSKHTIHKKSRFINDFSSMKRRLYSINRLLHCSLSELPSDRSYIRLLYSAIMSSRLASLGFPGAHASATADSARN